MNIREALLREHSKKQTNKLAVYIGKNKSKFADLMKCMLHKDTLLHQRAGWVFSVCTTRFPELVSPWFRKIIDALEEPYHDAVKRNITRTLQTVEIPLALQGKLTHNLFELLQSTDQPVAVKCFSMTVLLQLTRQHPDLKNELITIITMQLPFASAGFKSRGCKVLHELKQF